LDLRWKLKIDQSLGPTFQSAMSTKELAQNGWTAVPVDAGKIFQNGRYTNEPDYVDVNSIEFPSNDPIVSKTQQYAKVHLLKQTYHHSMRVYYWGG
jgi:cyanamide hydratase